MAGNLVQKLPLDQLNTKWASQINPILNNPLVQGQIVNGVKLINGQTVVNHGLGRKLLGWFIVGIDAPATVYDSQSANKHPELTLILNSNAVATANLWCF